MSHVHLPFGPVRAPKTAAEPFGYIDRLRRSTDMGFLVHLPLTFVWAPNYGRSVSLGWKALIVGVMALALFVLKQSGKKRPLPRAGRRRWVVEPRPPERDAPPPS